jgi:hypothetical protein
MDLGLAGIILSISVILLSLYRVIRNAFKEETLISFFPVLLVVFVSVVNLDLSFFLDLETFAWFLMIFALISTTPLPNLKPAES